jgi:hypothetical protein
LTSEEENLCRKTFARIEELEKILEDTEHICNQCCQKFMCLTGETMYCRYFEKKTLAREKIKELTSLLMVHKKDLGNLRELYWKWKLWAKYE